LTNLETFAASFHRWSLVTPSDSVCCFPRFPFDIDAEDFLSDVFSLRWYCCMYYSRKKSIKKMGGLYTVTNFLLDKSPN